MIFITVGSQMFQFDRLLKEIDELIEKKVITEKVFAQIGYSGYKPRNYEFENFIDRKDFAEYMKKANLIITHAGTGAIMTGIKAKKKVIAVPRLASFGEHVDDHQVQIIKEFEDMHIIESCFDSGSLEQAIFNTKNKEYQKYTSNTKKIIESLEEYIDYE